MFIQPRRLIVPEKLPLPRPRYAKPKRSAEPRRGGIFFGRRRRVGVGGVKAARGLEDLPGVGTGQGEDRDAVQGAAGGDDAGGAEAAASRLEADQVVECRRHTARPGGVRAEREGDQAAGDGYGRTGTGPAGDVTVVKNAGTRAIGGTGADQARGELVHVGLADQDSPGAFQFLNHSGRRLGDVTERRAGRRRCHAGHVHVVLDGEWDAVEGQCRLVAAFQVFGPRKDLLTRHQRNPDRVQARRLDAITDAGQDGGRGFARWRKRLAGVHVQAGDVHK